MTTQNGSVQLAGEVVMAWQRSLSNLNSSEVNPLKAG
jgi:hypothetical protein